MTGPLTLGYLIRSWLQWHLPSPRDETQRLELAPWQKARILRWYEVEPSGARCWNRCHDEDPKGKGKSPLAAAIDIVEFRGPVVFAGIARGGEFYDCREHGCSCGWGYEYEPGEPMGRTWGSPGLPPPWVQVVAVSEKQTGNTWAALEHFLTANRRRLAEHLRLEAGKTVVYWTDRDDAKIERVTSSAGSRTGQPITHATMDEPQEWTPALRGPSLATTVLANLTKLGGWSHFTGNAPVLGQGSVSEMLGYRYDDQSRRWEPVEAPRVLHFRPRPPVPPREDMTRDELRPLARFVYEDTPWTPIERILDDASDRAVFPWSEVARLFLNVPQDETAAGAWMVPETWDACTGEVRLVRSEPAFACVRVGHSQQHAAVVTAQLQGKGGRRIPLDRIGRPVFAEGDRVVIETWTSSAPDGERVSLADIERHLLDLRARVPARVRASVMVGRTERQRNRIGPEIALDGPFVGYLEERLRKHEAAVLSLPDTPQRLGPAAMTLMRHASDGSLVHDGDPELARQMANVGGTPTTAGWRPEAIDPDIPIVAARAAMHAIHRALEAPRWKPATVTGY